MLSLDVLEVHWKLRVVIISYDIMIIIILYVLRSKVISNCIAA